MAKTKVELQNYQGESLSPITIASNVLYEDGRNAQEVFEEYSNETFTPTIENSSSMFKVGQGDSVDYSANIVNGAYESMVLKGKTMVNCIQEPSSKDVVLPYEFEEGQYVTINDTKESGALGVELKGQTLVNLCKRPSTFVTMTDSSSSINLSITHNLQPNKKYAIIGEISEINAPNRGLCTWATHADGTEAYEMKRVTNAGRFFFTYNVTKEIKTFRVYIHGDDRDNGGTITIGNLMLLEYQEGMENWDIPYFEGMTSCKMPTLHTVESLFDAQKIIPNNTFTYSHSTNIGRFEFTNRVDVGTFTNIQLPAGTYDISFLVRGACDNGRVAITFAKDGQAWYDCSRVEIDYGKFGSTTFKEVKSQRTFDAPVTVTLVGHAWTGGATGSGWCEFKGIRLTPVGKTSILSLPEEVVLRSLPNGVCDTFNTRTGVYTQRIGEVVLDGENYTNFSRDSGLENDTTCKYFISNFFSQHLDGKGGQNEKVVLNCNYLPPVSFNHIQDKTLSTYPCIANSGAGSLNLRVGKDINSTSLLLVYLQSNPITVQYELENPIITKINLPSTLKSWNTTTHIYSEIPENTLYPTLSHSNPTYPVILKPSTKYSIVANSYSNNHSNSAINFNLGGATTSTTVGNRVTTITTPSTLSNELLTMSGRGNKLNNVMVIEGDVVGDEPYFEGICDCKSPILSNVGKNLWSIPSKAFDGKNYTASSGNGYYGCKIMTLPRGTYFIKGTLKNNDIVDDYMYFGLTSLSTNYNGNHSFNVFYITGKGYNTNITNGFKIEITSDFQDIYLWSTSKNSSSIQRVLNCLDRVHMELTNEEDVVYEPYKSNTTTFDQKDGKTIVLRSLPNGVCDTLNVETGEYVQRIGELVADGSNIGYNVNAIGVGEMDTFRFQLSDPSIKNVPEVKGNLICDQLPWRVIWSASVERTIGCYVANSENRIIVRMLKEKFDTLNVDGINRYLTNNPITFQYELATPIVTTIDVQGFPYAYTNGHVQLSSGSIEQSLTPTVEYSVATNRNGQIRTNQKMVEKHQQHLDQLQAMIISNMVNTQYQQTLTTLNYDLLKKEVGE